MYVRAKTIVHAFMIELDQLDNLDYWYLKKINNIVKYYVKSQNFESCALVISQILAEFCLERATYKTLHD